MTQWPPALPGYSMDPRTRVWRRPDARAVAYSDGEAAENALLSALRAMSDRSLHSDELAAHIRDWNTEYHFSPSRANLLRPLPIRQGDRVLELGAGCGAMTRWLGECGARVLAVEGSDRRAEVAALRCADLDNVCVVASDITEFSAPLRFDWVLLIGVLEYARIYGKGLSAELRYLGVAREHLAADGCLVVAIENRLGAKYLAGCSEDHIGVPYFGVQDLYTDKTPATYGRIELTHLVQSSGLEVQEILLPMPDYKLPSLVLRDDPSTGDRLDIGDLLSQTFSRDYSGMPIRAFSESLAWSSFAKNRLWPDVANSFLVLATDAGGSGEAKRPPQDALAWAYSTQRRPQHWVETVFRTVDQDIVVDKRGIGRASPSRSREGGPTFRREEGRRPYVRGSLLSALVHRALARNDAVTAERLLDRWIGALLEHAATHDSTFALPGHFVDAIPTNAIVAADDRLTFFDLEWICNRDVPLAWLALRGILRVALSADTLGPFAGDTVFAIASRLLAGRQLQIRDEDVRAAVDLDAALLREALFDDRENVTFPLTDEAIRRPLAPRVELVFDAAATKPLADPGLGGALDETEVASSQVRRLQSNLIGLHRSLSAETAAHASTIREVHRLSDDLATVRTHLEAERGMHAQNIEKLLATSEQAHVERTRLNAALRTESDERARLAHEAARAHVAIEDVRSRLDAAQAIVTQQYAELAMLHLERSTWGAKVGRVLTRQRNRWFPPQSRRGRAVTLAAKLAEAVAREGAAGAMRRTGRYVARRTESASQRALDSAADDSGITRRADPAELEQWIRANEPDDDALERQRSAAASFAVRPLISVVLPVYIVDTDILEATLDSLLAQTYDGWEACIAYADLENETHWSLLQSYAARDARFRIVRLEQNNGIAANSNRALELAGGEYIALLDHDDMLSPSGFFAVVERLNAEPDLDFIYTDKDSIDAAGGLRRDALFKPQWSPETLHSVNYLTHLNVIRRKIISDIGGWRSETDGAQDWDLFFRVCERTHRIARVTGLHYHWRIVATSTSTGIQAKPYAAAAQLRCQRERMARMGFDVAVDPHEESGFKFTWRLPEHPVVDVVVHSFEDRTMLTRCLDALAATTLTQVARIRVMEIGGHPSGHIPSIAARSSPVPPIETLAAPSLPEAVSSCARSSDAPFTLFVDARADRFSSDFVWQLCGWLSGHAELAWVAAIALRHDETVIEAGRVVGRDGLSAPLFRNTPLRSWGWFGGSLWYRNSSGASPHALAMRTQDIARSDAIAAQDASRYWALLCGALRGSSRRGMINPVARVYFPHDPETRVTTFDPSFEGDPYFHPAFRSVAPLRLVE